MNRYKNLSLLIIPLVACILLFSCNNRKKNKTIVSNPEQMDEQTSQSIQQALEFGAAHNGKIDDTLHLKLFSAVNSYYSSKEFANIWSHNEKWMPLTDSLFQFIRNSESYGLYPKDYHLKDFQSLKQKLDDDSIKRMDANLWTSADLMLTDAFMHLVKDLKKGRLSPDSTFLKFEDSIITDKFYFSTLQKLLQEKQLTSLVSSLEPVQQGYWALKNNLKLFLDSMDRRNYTYVAYPFKPNSAKDSLSFIKTFEKRLQESGAIDATEKMDDSTRLSLAIKKYQKKTGMKQDGKISAALIKKINSNDVERLKRICITLDRYKQMPRQMPEKYVWVNIPSYYMQLWDMDTVVFESKIICGKPDTKTPLLYSVISNMVTYPTWTVPNSIIKKQYLPKLKTNPFYLSKLGLHLVDSKGETVDPATVKWSKYTNGIPYKVMQGSGDDNALGVLKFNFKNPYSVYLHDTNQRYLFKNGSRALSHGCVRVEQWDRLAYYIAANDSINLKPGDKLSYTIDSIKNWLAAKERKSISVKNGIPLFIAYFSCEAKGNKIKFYEDIYGDDKGMRDKFFSDK